jgi:hypothetical protein
MEITLEDLANKVENLSLAVDMLGLNLSAIQNQHLENALVLHTMSSKINKMFEWMEKSNKSKSLLLEKIASNMYNETTSHMIIEEPETRVLMDEFNKLDVTKDVAATADIFIKLLDKFPVRTDVPPPIHPSKHYDCPLD